MATALITGIDGFTGRYLAKELSFAGYLVKGISLEASENVFSCDLLDRTKLIDVVSQIQPDVVVHLAGTAFIATGDAESFYQSNVVCTKNLLEAIAESGSKPSSVLLASSANIYGNVTLPEIDETTIPSPTNDYSMSKLEMENMARGWFDQLPITIVRPFNYTGVGQALNFLLPKIVDHFKHKTPILELGNLDIERDFSDVRSVVKSYHGLLEANSAGKIFNICSGQGHSLLEILQIMHQISGHKPDVIVNPEFVRANEIRRLVGCRKLLDDTVGALPTIPLRNTLKWMLETQ